MIKQFSLVFGLLLISGFLLVWDSPPESFMRKQVGQIEQAPSADSYMTSVVSRRFGDDGTEQYVLSSLQMDFFNDSSRLQLSEPHLVAKQAQQQALININANTGILTNNGKTLVLAGNVIAIVDEPAGTTELTAANIRYQPATSIATTAGRFKLRTPQVTLSGTGLEANLATDIFIIKSRVRAVHEPL
jgi:LPS export ABC transporter protein LptC